MFTLPTLFGETSRKSSLVNFSIKFRICEAECELTSKRCLDKDPSKKGFAHAKNFSNCEYVLKKKQHTLCFIVSKSIYGYFASAGGKHSRSFMKSSQTYRDTSTAEGVLKFPSRKYGGKISF